MGANLSGTNYVIDEKLLLHDTATAIGASDFGQVGGVDRIVDLGAGTATTVAAAATAPGVVRGEWVVDVTTLEIASGDEDYTFLLSGSDSHDFSTGTPAIVNLATLRVGDSSILPGAAATDSIVGRYVVGFTNEFPLGAIPKRYVRLELVAAGTIATGVIFTSYLSLDRTV